MSQKIREEKRAVNAPQLKREQERVATHLPTVMRPLSALTDPEGSIQRGDVPW